MSLVPRRSELAYPTLSDGVIARYCPSLTGPTGNKVYDLSGNNQDGEIVNFFVPDMWRRNAGEWSVRSYGLDTGSHFSDDGFRAPPSLIRHLTSNSDFSASLWFNRRGTWSSGTLMDSAGGQIHLSLASSGNAINMRCKGAILGFTSSTPVTMVSNTWYNVTITIKGSTLTPYLDGVAMTGASGGWDVGTAFVGGSDFNCTLGFISFPWSASNGQFVGATDDINLYDRVLTHQEILQLASQRGAPYKTLSHRTTFQAVAGEITREETQSLGLTQVVGNNGFSSTDSAISFAQSATFFKSGSLSTPVSQSLAFTQTAVLMGRESESHLLMLDSTALFRIGLPVAGFFITHTLGFVEIIRRGQDYGVNQTLAFVQNAFRANTGAHLLGFTQSVVFGRGKGVTSLLNLAQSVLVNSRLGRSTLQVFGLLDSVSYRFNERHARCNYSRFEGSGTAPLIPVKPYTQKTVVSFESLIGPKQLLTIATPDMDNKHRLSFDRVNRETSGGELEVYRDPSWVPTQTLLFTIRGIKTANFSTLRTFMYSTLGTEILFNDWLGTTWVGVITNPDEPATEDQDGYWTMAFEFFGKPYAGPPAFAPLAFTQTATFTL